MQHFIRSAMPSRYGILTSILNASPPLHFLPFPLHLLLPLSSFPSSISPFPSSPFFHFHPFILSLFSVSFPLPRHLFFFLFAHPFQLSASPSVFSSFASFPFSICYFPFRFTLSSSLSHIPFLFRCSSSPFPFPYLLLLSPFSFPLLFKFFYSFPLLLSSYPSFLFPSLFSFFISILLLSSSPFLPFS
jgi:hypothetical protein